MANEIIGQLMNGVGYLASKKVLHLCLHPSRVLLHLSSCAVQLSDFSRTISYFDKNEKIEDPLAEIQTEKDFFSPERKVWHFLVPYAEDSWAIGATLFYMLAGEVG